MFPLIARVAVGVYLLVHYLRLLPFGAALFSDAGMLADPGLNPGAAAAISPLYFWDSPAVVRGLILGLVGAAGAYTVGFRTRTMGLLLGLGAMFLWQRNMLTLNPSLPFLGFWFVAQLFTRADPPGSVDRWLARRRRGATGGAVPATADADEVVPADLDAALWIVTTVAYCFSGWTKLVSPAWATGDAVGWMLNGPIGLDNPLARLLGGLPHPVTAAATWGVVAVELLAPLALWPRLRAGWWWAVLAMHLGLVCVVDLRDISFGMIAVHLTLAANLRRRGAVSVRATSPGCSPSSSPVPTPSPRRPPIACPSPR